MPVRRRTRRAAVPSAATSRQARQAGGALNLIFLGPPGAGKGTQAQLVAAACNLCHISTGDLLRQAVAQRTPTGVKAKGYMDRGELAPDDLVVALVVAAMTADACRNGWLLDGFPRTLAQAQALDASAAHLGSGGPQIVVYFAAADAVLIERISGRRTCRNCGAGYHVAFMPPAAAGACDRCGGPLYQRDDDTPETVANRLRVYHRQTAPLIDYYQAKGLLRRLDASGRPDAVRQALERLMDAALHG